MPCYKALGSHFLSKLKVMPRKDTCAGEDTRTTAGRETGGTLCGFMDARVGMAVGDLQSSCNPFFEQVVKAVACYKAGAIRFQQAVRSWPVTKLVEVIFSVSYESCPEKKRVRVRTPALQPVGRPAVHCAVSWMRGSESPLGDLLQSSCNPFFEQSVKPWPVTKLVEASHALKRNVCG